MMFDAVAEVFEPCPMAGADLVVDGVSFFRSGETRCQVQPLSPDAAFRSFGVEADRAVAVYCPVGSARMLDKVGTRLLVGDDTYATVSSPQVFEMNLPCDHAVVAARWLEWRPDVGAGGGRQSSGAGAGPGGFGRSGGVPL